MAERYIPRSASHVKFENEFGHKCEIDLEHHETIVILKGPHVLRGSLTPIEATQLRDALMALEGLPKSKRFVFYKKDR